MQRIVKEIPADCEIMALSCTHEGTYLMHEDGINEVIEYIGAVKNRYWLHLGDWIEAIATDDKRYDHDTTKEPIPHKQARNIAKLFKKIKKKGIVGLHGNHEIKLHRYANYGANICDELGIPYGTGMCRIIFTDKKEQVKFKMLSLHGKWLFNSQHKDRGLAKANEQAKLKMVLNPLIGDCHAMVCGHAHKIIVVPPIHDLYLSDGVAGVRQHYHEVPYGADYIPKDLRWYACCGSFRRNYMDGVSDYAEYYGPVELGCVKIIINDYKIMGMEPFNV